MWHFLKNKYSQWVTQVESHADVLMHHPSSAAAFICHSSWKVSIDMSRKFKANVMSLYVTQVESHADVYVSPKFKALLIPLYISQVQSAADV